MALKKVKNIKRKNTQRGVLDVPATPRVPGSQSSQYRAEYAERAEKYCWLGATDRELAELFEVSNVTIWSWQSAHPAFFAALKRGKENADERVARSLYGRATGYTYETEKLFYDKDAGVVRATTTEHVPPDVTACIFWLKNRNPAEWRDAVTSMVDIKLTHISANMTLDEKQAAYRQILASPPAALMKLVSKDKDAT